MKPVVLYTTPIYSRGCGKVYDMTNEGAIGTVAKLGAVAGIGTGVYEGIKQHKIEARKKMEKRNKWKHLTGGAGSNFDTTKKRHEELSRRRFELKKHRLDRKIRDADRDLDDLDEGMGTAIKAAGLGIAAYGGYKIGKNISTALTKKVADNNTKAREEHEYAFRETPKETRERVQYKAKAIRRKYGLHESVVTIIDGNGSIMSRSW